MSNDFTSIWYTEQLGNHDRKRMVRLLIEDVTLIKDTEIVCHIRFKGGSCQTLNLPLPQKVWKQRKTPSDVIAAIDELLNDYPSYKIADILNKRGMKSGTGQRFSLTHVERIRITYKLSTCLTRLRKQGKLTANELACRLGVSSGKIRRSRELGFLKAYEFREGRYLYDDPGADVTTRIPELKPNAHLKTVYTTNEVQYET